MLCIIDSRFISLMTEQSSDHGRLGVYCLSDFIEQVKIDLSLLKPDESKGDWGWGRRREEKRHLFHV